MGLIDEVYPPGVGENVLHRLDVVGLSGGGGAQGGHALPISRGRKNEFLAALTDYVGEVVK